MKNRKCFKGPQLEGILTVGGYRGGSVSSSTVEIFNPRSGRSCKIGDLPVATHGLTLCGNLACGGSNSQERSCSRFDGAGTFTALSVTLREKRAYHLCWQLQSGEVLLLGGWHSGSTTEKLSADGSSSTADFGLPYGISDDSCGIERNGKFIVTGGVGEIRSKPTVVEFTDSGEVTYLADLQDARYHHACSKFVDTNGETALLVTGGVGISSTEIYLNSQWSFAASLPTPRFGLRASVVQNSVYVSGGYDDFDTILRYNASSDTWFEAGQLTEPKYFHALTTVDINYVCS